jgi:N-glycosylase/DNA lyase
MQAALQRFFVVLALLSLVESLSRSSQMVTTRRRRLSALLVGKIESEEDQRPCETPPKRLKQNNAQTPPLVRTSSNNKRNTPVSPKTPVILKTSDVAQIATSSKYKDLRAPPNELRPSATLTIGQCFHWRTVSSSNDVATSESAWGTHDATEWVGVLRTWAGDSFTVAIKETPDTTLYRILQGPQGLPYERILREYFQLDCPLAPLYEEWSRQDPRRLSRIAKCIPGVRLIDQDPWECLISFICSSNNNIPRITKMLAALREQYGKPLVTIQGEETDTVLYSFPSFVELRSKATESDLRISCGMGYRAKYIMATMETLESLGGEHYLQELRKLQDPIEVQERLLVFTGVGRKVADCVALFSLRQADAIPVDTHVWDICRRDYDEQGIFRNVKSLTPTIYRAVGDTFRSQFKPNAGWAHSLLFVAELPSFRPALHEDIVEEMDKVSSTSYPTDPVTEVVSPSSFYNSFAKAGKSP